MDDFDKGVFFLDLTEKKAEEEEIKREPSRFYSPSTDIFETRNGVYIVIEIPGVDIGSVTIHVSGNRLTVQGIKEQEHVRDGAVFLCMERRYGQFRKEFEIIGAVNTLDARARYHEGVLKIFMERCEEKRGKGKRVAIETEGK